MTGDNAECRSDSYNAPHTTNARTQLNSSQAQDHGPTSVIARRTRRDYTCACGRVCKWEKELFMYVWVRLWEGACVWRLLLMWLSVGEYVMENYLYPIIGS